MSKRLALSAAVLFAAGWCLATEVVVPTPDPGWTRKQLVLPDLDLTPVAEAFEKSGEFVDAAEVYGTMARLASKDANRGYAKLRQADCLFAAGKYRKAHEAYDEVRKSYVTYVPFEHLTGMLRKLAEAYASGQAVRFGGHDYETARAIYGTILEISPTGPEAPADTIRLAQLQRSDDLYDLAITTLEDVHRRFPNCPEEAEARVELTRTWLEKARASRGDVKVAKQAQLEAKRFLEQYPQHPLATQAEGLRKQADEAMVQYYLYLGEFYLRGAHYRPEASRRYLNAVVANASGTRSGARAQVLLARLPPGKGTPAVPPTDLIREERTVPPPPAVPGGVAATTGAPPAAARPAARQLIEEQERVKKWLLPITDLELK